MHDKIFCFNKNLMRSNQTYEEVKS